MYDKNEGWTLTCVHTGCILSEIFHISPQSIAVVKNWQSCMRQIKCVLRKL